MNAVVETAAKVAFLSRPGAYPHGPERVEVIETHMSWVFLAGSEVYKLKKPVRTGFLDFSTLALRRHFCEEEVRLNRRLAGDVYRGVVALTCDAGGDLALDGPGRPVDWLVHSRRLPRERMLDACLRRGAVGPAEVEPLGRRLAAFYREAPRVRLAPGEYRRRLEEAVAVNHGLLAQPRFGLSRDAVAAVRTGLEAFIAEHAALLESRAASGRIVEGHGDLRPEHVCLVDPPVVIDCLEFNRRFRELDPLDELGFLALECRRLGAAFVGEVVLGLYRERCADDAPPVLLDFYQALRAQLRARLCIAHLDDHPAPPRVAHWREQAEDYLRHALAALASARGTAGVGVRKTDDGGQKTERGGRKNRGA